MYFFYLDKIILLGKFFFVRIRVSKCYLEITGDINLARMITMITDLTALKYGVLPANAKLQLLVLLAGFTSAQI